MTTRRRAIRAGRALAQVGAAALVVGGVVWAAEQPPVSDRIDAVDIARAAPEARHLQSTTVALEQAVRACAGPELLGLAGARDLGLPTSATVVSAPPAALGDSPAPRGAPGLAIALPDPDRDTAGPQSQAGSVTEELTSPTSYLALGAGAAAPGLVATQETRASTEEVAGLGTVPCQIATPEAWILGGGAGAGHAERIVLSNPASNAVTVDIRAFGADGPSDPPAGQGVVVPGQGRVVLLGDALMPDEASPVFAITAHGGDVAAALIETVIEGTRPVGFDVVGASTPPAEEQIIPGVLQSQGEDGVVTVRIANPGDVEAIATISHLAEDGEIALPEGVARVPAGSVTDVPVTALPPGVTTLRVTADSPVVAAARTVVDDGGADSLWAVSPPAVTELAGAALPPAQDINRRLVISSWGGASTVEVIEVGDGTATTTQMPVSDGGTVVVAAGGDGIWIRPVSGSGALFGAVVSVGTGVEATEVSSMPLITAPTSARRSEVVALP